MNRLLLSAFFNCFIFPLMLSVTAQQSQESEKVTVTNVEPAHASYLLNNDRYTSFRMSSESESGELFTCFFDYEPAWNGKQVFVRLYGFSEASQLKINAFNYGTGGKHTEEAEFNITPFLKKERNKLELLFHSAAEVPLRIQDESGVLFYRDPVHIRDFQVTTYPQPDSREILVRVNLFIQSYLTERNGGRWLTLTISDPEGKMITQKRKALDFPLAFRQQVEFTFDHIIEEPVYWSPGKPFRYSLELKLVEKGKEEGDQVISAFGIKTVSIQDSLLVFNQDTIVPRIVHWNNIKQTFMKSDEALLNLLRGEGFNAVQTETSLPSRVMELFDQHGIVVLRNEADRVPERDRPDVNRPSVIWTE